jgi:DNA-binding MarR family transcriptional regulator
MKPSKLDRSPVHLFHRTMQLAHDLFMSQVEGTTPRQLAILIAIDANPGASQTVLTECTGIDRSTLSQVVRRLRKTGLVRRRRRADDSRAYAVELTDDGRRILRAAEPMARKVDERVLGALPSARREPFIALLSSLIEAFGTGTESDQAVKQEA